MNPKPKHDSIILVRRDALLNAQSHASASLDHEAGGLLIGNILENSEFVTIVVMAIIRARKAISHTASLEFTPECWADMWCCIDNHPEYCDESSWRVVGWYHTHPSFGVFLSSMDLSIHKNFFCHDGHIALVLDPVRLDQAFFGWNKEHTDIAKKDSSNINIMDDKELLSWLRQNKLLTSSTALPIAEIHP